MAADDRPLALLQKELKEYDLQFVRFPGYRISYPEKGSMAIKMLRSAPRIIRGIREEHHALRELVKKHAVNAVISDNRFGLWTRQVPCIFITHQLMIKSPVGEKLLHRLNSSYISKYDECWIPDAEGKLNLSGDLSHKYALPRNTHYIGPLSRFEKLKTENGKEAPDKYDLVALISGPEPQRTLFESIITAQALRSFLRTLIVQGKPESGSMEAIGGTVTVIPHLQTAELFEIIRSASLVISRPGYSTVMDLAAIGGKAIFVPTPGQTEQEYLGELLMKKGIAYCMKQDKLDLQAALNESKKYKGFSEGISTGSYRERIDALLERI